MSSLDLEIKMVNARTPGDFEDQVNELLQQGSWRVAETEMSVTDSHYWAMLVKSNEVYEKPSGFWAGRDFGFDDEDDDEEIQTEVDRLREALELLWLGDWSAHSGAETYSEFAGEILGEVDDND